MYRKMMNYIKIYIDIYYIYYTYTRNATIFDECNNALF